MTKSRQADEKTGQSGQFTAQRSMKMVAKGGVILFFLISVSAAFFLGVILEYGAFRNQNNFTLSSPSQSPSVLTAAAKHLKHLMRVRSVGGVKNNPLFCNPLPQPPAEPNSLSNIPLSPTVKRAVSSSFDSERAGEALAAKNLAKDMVVNGKMEKALKLYEHALALAPNHPDILNDYGEFLENKQKDIVSAEHLYCRALVKSPSHSRALSNRKRTLPLVEEIDQNSFNRIDQKRDVLMSVPDNHPGLRRQIHEDYFRHIYHSAAIEGNTFTLSQTRSLVENRLAIGGKSVMEHNEILGMDAALHFINSTLIKRLGNIQLQDILDLHHRVLGFVEPLEAGRFRKTQVFVGDFTPPSPSDVHTLMLEFIEWLNSDDALSLHPIELAALAHYKLVYIHPFYDGNGRTSRLLMNLVLMQAGYPPIIIKVEEKHEYYKHLQTANDGDVRPFIRFIAQCTERTIDDYLLASLESVNIHRSISTHRDDGRTIILDDLSSSSEHFHDEP